MRLSQIILLSSLFGFSSLLQAACWERAEYRKIEGYAELDNKLILSYKDAVSCEPVDGASVQLGKLVYRTDARGYVKLPMTPFVEANDLEMPLKISKEGYVTVHTDLIVAAGTVLNRRMLLSPTLSGQGMRFILQWNDEPRDLDLHLEGDGYHISYRDMKSSSQARLDQDETDGYGPETITISSVNGSANYKLWVNNYSAESGFTGNEKVLVYAGSKLLHVIPIKPTNSKRVDILEIHNSSLSRIEQKNVISAAVGKSNSALSRRVFPGW